MRSKRATEPRELSAIVKREILPGLAISVSFAALSPFALGRLAVVVVSMALNGTIIGPLSWTSLKRQSLYSPERMFARPET